MCMKWASFSSSPLRDSCVFCNTSTVLQRGSCMIFTRVKRADLVQLLRWKINGFRLFMPSSNLQPSKPYFIKKKSHTLKSRLFKHVLGSAYFLTCNVHHVVSATPIHTFPNLHILSKNLILRKLCKVKLVFKIQFDKRF